MQEKFLFSDIGNIAAYLLDRIIDNIIYYYFKFHDNL